MSIQLTDKLRQELVDVTAQISKIELTGVGRKELSALKQKKKFLEDLLADEITSTIVVNQPAQFSSPTEEIITQLPITNHNPQEVPISDFPFVVRDAAWIASNRDKILNYGNAVFLNTGGYFLGTGVNRLSDLLLYGLGEQIPSGNTTQYFRGDKTFQTLDTTAVIESGNLYFTNLRAINATLDGFTGGAGAISATDSVLSALQKLDGNISSISISKPDQEVVYGTGSNITSDSLFKRVPGAGGGYVSLGYINIGYGNVIPSGFGIDMGAFGNPMISCSNNYHAFDRTSADVFGNQTFGISGTEVVRMTYHGLVLKNALTLDFGVNINGPSRIEGVNDMYISSNNNGSSNIVFRPAYVETLRLTPTTAYFTSPINISEPFSNVTYASTTIQWNGSAYSTILYNRIGDSNYGNALGNGAVDFTTSSTAGMLIGTLTTGSLGFGTNNILRQVITSDGKIGINTVSPSYRLQISSAASDEVTFSIDGLNGLYIQSNLGGVQTWSQLSMGADRFRIITHAGVPTLITTTYEDLSVAPGAGSKKFSIIASDLALDIPAIGTNSVLYMNNGYAVGTNLHFQDNFAGQYWLDIATYSQIGYISGYVRWAAAGANSLKLQQRNNEITLEDASGIYLNDGGGNTKVRSLVGSSSRIMETDSVGGLSASITIGDARMTDVVDIALIINTVNWTGVNYTGAALTNTIAGAMFNDATYVYYAPANNQVIRWGRS